jgi:hypothetical protein
MLKSSDERTSTVNKTKSPVVEKNYKARAAKASNEEIAVTREETPTTDTKIVKAIGMGRHRSQINDEDFPVDVREEEEKPVVQEERQTVVRIEEPEEDVPSAPMCGICC